MRGVGLGERNSGGGRDSSASEPRGGSGGGSGDPGWGAGRARGEECGRPQGEGAWALPARSRARTWLALPPRRRSRGWARVSEGRAARGVPGPGGGGEEGGGVSGAVWECCEPAGRLPESGWGERRVAGQKG